MDAQVVDRPWSGLRRWMLAWHQQNLLVNGLLGTAKSLAVNLILRKQLWREQLRNESHPVHGARNGNSKSDGNSKRGTLHLKWRTERAERNCQSMSIFCRLGQRGKGAKSCKNSKQAQTHAYQSTVTPLPRRASDICQDMQRLASSSSSAFKNIHCTSSSLSSPYFRSCHDRKKEAVEGAGELVLMGYNRFLRGSARKGSPVR